MAITKSAKKALRQNLKRRKRNLIYKNKIKNLTKKIKSFISQNKIDEAKNMLPQLYKAIDKAAKIKLIKKNTAARKKSRITQYIIKSQLTKNPKQDQAQERQSLT
jgi:small subunit ribosomal protein S20